MSFTLPLRKVATLFTIGLRPTCISKCEAVPSGPSIKYTVYASAEALHSPTMSSFGAIWFGRVSLNGIPRQKQLSRSWMWPRKELVSVGFLFAKIICSESTLEYCPKMSLSNEVVYLGTFLSSPRAKDRATNSTLDHFIGLGRC